MDQSKRRKFTSGTSAVAATNDTPENLPPCLKLIVDCWEQILDLLSLEDVHSLGGTCKMLNRLAGHYFKTYFPEKIYNLFSNEIRVTSANFNVRPDFYQFIGELKITSGSDVNYILDANVFSSLKSLRWYYIDLDETQFGRAQSVLKNIENIHSFTRSIAKNTFDQLAIHCPNLVSLIVKSFLGEHLTNFFSQYYPKLEHLEIRCGNEQADNLEVFLEKHSKLNRLSIDFGFLWANRILLMKMNVQLEVLQVGFEKTNVPHGEIVDCFNVLYNRGFYKKLFLYIDFESMDVSNALYELPALKKLDVYSDSNIDFSRLTHLNELLVWKLREIDLEKMAKNLAHLERLHIFCSTIDELLPFIRHSKRLKELGVICVLRSKIDVADLRFFDEERQKFAGACPISIIVKEGNYLPAKWSTKNLNLNHVKIERF